MKILRVTELREWAKEKGFPDSWWFSVDGTVSTEPAKLSNVPKAGAVHVMNASCLGTADEEWIWFRYSGYKTPEEIAEANAPTDRQREQLARFGRTSEGLTKKEASDLLSQLFEYSLTESQKVALEFFGYNSEEISKKEASAILDRGFKNCDSEAYRRFQWQNRHRLWDQREILRKVFDGEVSIRERVPAPKKFRAIDDALANGIDEDNFIPFLQSNYPEIFLADSTVRRKRADQRRWDEMRREIASEGPASGRGKAKRSGCLVGISGLLLGVLVWLVVR